MSRFEACSDFTPTSHSHFFQDRRWKPSCLTSGQVQKFRFVLMRLVGVDFAAAALFRFCEEDGGGSDCAMVRKAATTAMSAMAALGRASWRELNDVVVCALLFSTSLLSLITHGQGAAGLSPNAIFVFGDSYLDTGNHNKSAGFGRPWLPPYGMTYPGTPAGRFSDGRVFADVFANALQMPSPIAYEQRLSDPNAPKYGMNFAVGGAGVFSAYGMLDLGGQIDQFESLVNTVYPKVFLKNSVVLVGIHGNDYGAYLAKGNPLSGIPKLQRMVVDDMVYQLERLNKLGLNTFYINNVQPTGCLPSSTRPEFIKCSELSNVIISVGHNDLLVAAVANLTQRLQGATFTILDHFSAFNTVLRDPANYGISADPLMPCCLGAGNATRSCGDVGPDGKAMFRVCENPSKSFFLGHSPSFPGRLDCCDKSSVS